MTEEQEKVQLEEQQKKLGEEKAELLKKLGEVLKEFHNEESNIPPSHEYWDNLNRFRSLR